MQTLWEKEKLLILNNFSFSHSVFYPFGELSAFSNKFQVVCKLFQFGSIKNLSFGKELNASQYYGAWPTTLYNCVTFNSLPNDQILDRSKFESFCIRQHKCDLTLSQTSPDFTYLQSESIKNTVGKGEIARNKQFLLFPQCFLSVGRTICHFHQFLNCRLQTLSVWEESKICRLGKG